ncbi:MAG: hypothetical protein EOP09_03685, partial [Proteobacteria bacterium]
MTEYVVDNLENLELKKRSDIHWARKIWHMTSVFGMFIAYTFMPEKASFIVLGTAILLFLPMDFLRLRYPAFNDWIVHALKPIMRTSEIHKIAGTTYLLTGVGIVVFLFPRPIV